MRGMEIGSSNCAMAGSFKSQPMKNIMFNILRTSFVLFTLTLFASAASKEDISREVEATSGGKLVVEVDFGSIDVAAGSENKVTLEAHRKIDFGDESSEKEYLANAPITLSREGDVVTIRSRGKRADHWNVGHQEMDAQYIVRVPKKFAAALQTDGGAISVKEIAGEVKAHTSGGAIELDDCHGTIDIETSGGHIKVADAKGSLKANTSGGGIEVRNFSGDTDVRTSGGGLILEKISGKLAGKTSGGGIRAAIPGALAGDVKLETNAGNIDLAVPASAAFTIDAKTSVGEVVSRLPIQSTDVDREHLRGTLNGGGKSVHLTTSAGSITIEPAPSELARQ